ncbi:MAG: hypothetical protein COZ95_01300 [Nitrospirae bacterium CG_4_8_14_3_um_filter_50_41]|nr:MAG: hypothetical protein COZ95_01300 [Nitrospirae bacterium CG_4_8_14_3_um_filter_50_41]
MERLTIGKAAKMAGISTDTIRYYQRLGLLPDAERLESGYRVFTFEAVRVARFIKRAQALGFSLNEIKELIAFRQDSGTSCRDVKNAATRKVAVINKKIEDLSAIRDALSGLIRTCERGGGAVCPILESLDKEEKS